MYSRCIWLANTPGCHFNCPTLHLFVSLSSSPIDTVRLCPAVLAPQQRNTDETRSRNRRHKSALFLAPVSATSLRVSCKSVTGFVWYQIPAPRTLFYYKLESGVRVTENWSFMIYLFSTYPNSGRLGEFIVCVAFEPRLFSALEIFFPDVGTKNRRRKQAPENGVYLWRRFLERLSLVLLAHVYAVCIQIGNMTHT